MTIENFEAEIFWNRFPDCFANLKDLGYTAEIQAKFPDFKRTELEVGRRRLCDAVGFRPGRRLSTAAISMKRPASIRQRSRIGTISSPPVRRFPKPIPASCMAQADFNGDSEWFRMIANEQGCGYFSTDGQAITINQPACVRDPRKGQGR